MFSQRFGSMTLQWRHNDMIAMASQITSLTIVYLIVYSGTDQRKHQSSASLAFVRGIHRGSVNSSHKGPVTRKMFPFDDVIMTNRFARKIYPGPLYTKRTPSQKFEDWFHIILPELCVNRTDAVRIGSILVEFWHILDHYAIMDSETFLAHYGLCTQ